MRARRVGDAVAPDNGRPGMLVGIGARLGALFVVVVDFDDSWIHEQFVSVGWGRKLGSSVKLMGC